MTVVIYNLWESVRELSVNLCYKLSMTEITPFARSTAVYGLSLVLPAYKSAFVTIGKVWLLLAFGAVVAVTSDLFVGQYLDDGFPNLGAMQYVLGVFFLASPAILLFIYLVVSAKVWTVSFNALDSKESPFESLFGRQEKVAFWALFKVTLVSISILVWPLIAFAIVYTGFIFLTNGPSVMSDSLTNALFLGVAILYKLIIARYLMTIPISIAASSSSLFKGVPLAQAWQRTKDWYPIILMALIPIAMVESGVSHVIGITINDVLSAGVSLPYWRLALPVIYYCINVITALATLHVILKVWSQTHVAEVELKYNTVT
jgi:hypothetical protein